MNRITIQSDEEIKFPTINQYIDISTIVLHVEPTATSKTDYYSPDEGLRTVLYDARPLLHDLPRDTILLAPSTTFTLDID